MAYAQDNGGAASTSDASQGKGLECSLSGAENTHSALERILKPIALTGFVIVTTGLCPPLGLYYAYQVIRHYKEI